jgi:diacylglycerol kinase
MADNKVFFFRSLIKIIKDLPAAGIPVAVIAAVAAGCFVFIPEIIT